MSTYLLLDGKYKMRLIDADKFDLSLFDCDCSWSEIAEKIIKNAPTVDVQPVKHGRWEVIEHSEGRELCKCSSCGEILMFYYGFCPKYCPDCGAKMSKE